MARSFFQSLHFKIAAGVIGTVLLLSTTYFILDYRFYRAQLLNEAQDSAESVARVTLNSLVQMAMLGEHPELLQRAVESLSRESNVQSVFVLDRSGVVRFSSNKNELGRVFKLDEPSCKVCHLNGTNPPSSEFFELSGRQILRHAIPIRNRVECQSCHSGGEPLLGVLIVDFPTSGMQKQLQSNLTEMLFKAGFTVLTILLVLGVVLNRVVISRIRRLTELVSRVGPKHDTSELESLKGEDEIGQLAGSFQKMAESLTAHCDELEEKERVRVSLLERLVHSQEEERRSMSRELHDHLGQSLSALLLDFRTTVSEAKEEEIQKWPHHREIEMQIRDLIDDVHRLAWQMRPSILDDYGLNVALERFLEEASTRSGLRLDYQQIPEEGLGRLPIWVEVTLYRIAQESINNIIKHAQATRASVILMKRESSVTLLVEDNGKGFKREETASESDHGLGLLGMRERALQCGGTLDVESAAQKGTTIRVRIPLDQRHEWQSA